MEMCNLYSMTKGQAAIRELTRAMADSAWNLAPLPALFPDAMAPVVFAGAAGRELTMMRWGMPGPAAPLPAAPLPAAPGQTQFGGAPVTNIRNTASPHWRRWLGVEHRCLVMATSFCEWADTSPRKTPVWFAVDESRPLFAFAGIWTRWTGTRGTKAAPVTGEHRVFGFLTTAANPPVGAVHPKAMPVVLTGIEEMEVWLRAGWGEAAGLQKPAADGILMEVARGAREDAVVG